MILKTISAPAIICISLLTIAGCGGDSNEDNSNLTSQPTNFKTLTSSTNTSSTNTSNTNASNTNASNTNASNTNASNPSTYPAPGVGCSLNPNQQAILSSVNKARSTARNCGSQRFSAAAPLQWNCLLADAAARHSLDMATQNFFSHTGSDGSDLGDRVNEAGYSFQYVGENIAAGHSNPDSTMASWLSSPGHCQNIMSPQFTELGSEVEYNAGAQYRYYWTLNFGRPR